MPRGLFLLADCVDSLKKPLKPLAEQICPVGADVVKLTFKRRGRDLHGFLEHVNQIVVFRTEHRLRHKECLYLVPRLDVDRILQKLGVVKKNLEGMERGILVRKMKHDEFLKNLLAV